MLEKVIVIVAAFILDLILGDPHFLWHPVQGMGYIIKYLERILRTLFGIRDDRELDKAKKRIAGGIMVVLVIILSVLPVYLILKLADIIHPYVRVSVEIIMCYQMLATRSLCVESMKVYKELKNGTIESARNAVSMIVGRDTQKLDEVGVIKAAVETVAENTSDGVTAPLFYLALFGVYGAFIYKAVNTMDSMIGYKNDRYIFFGTAAAGLDDLLNYIPARISALLMILASYFLGLDGKMAWKIYKRDRYKHASPNSAQTEAVCAGALGVRLAGDAYYFGKLLKKPYIGDSLRDVEAEDIKRANGLMYITSILMLICMVAVIGVIMAVRTNIL